MGVAFSGKLDVICCYCARGLRPNSWDCWTDYRSRWCHAGHCFIWKCEIWRGWWYWKFV